MRVELLSWARLDYKEAWRRQKELLRKRMENTISDTLIIVEHPPVITVGRKYSQDKKRNFYVREKEIPCYFVERGGGATYHGPGQIVLYPIFRLAPPLGPKFFLRLLEEVIILALQKYHIEAFRIKDATGVWLWDHFKQKRKIASMGIAVRNFVSYHGLAFNLNTNLEHFHLISPCGFSSRVMTTLEEVFRASSIERMPSRDAVESLLVENLCSLYEKAQRNKDFNISSFSSLSFAHEAIRKERI